MPEAVIVATARSPIGRAFKGSLTSLRPDDMAAQIVRAVLAAKRALKSVEVAGHTPRMRVGIHTGRPQRLAADWLGVDVNIAARVMERATKGGIMVSSSTLDLIPQSELDALGVEAKRTRKPVFAPKPAGVPDDLAIYRLKTLKELSGPDDTDEAESQP